MDYVRYHIIDFIYLVLYQLKLIVPFWAVGILAGSVLSVYFDSQLTNLLNKINNYKSIYLAIIIGSVLGALSPITMYGMVPIVILMHSKGMHQSVLISFIVTSVLINPNVVFYSFVLGADIALLRLLICILTGFIAGILARIFLKNKEIFSFTFEDTPKNKKRAKYQLLLNNIYKSFKKTAPYLLLGVALTAVFEKFMPKDIFTNIFVNNTGLGVLFGAALGVPLYFCGGGTIALIHSWMSYGMSTGSIMAFVVAGPGTKINNVLAISTMINKKYLLLYLMFIVAISIILGLLIDLILII
ncbi:MAG: permease [Eubacteriales bacterium]